MIDVFQTQQTASRTTSTTTEGTVETILISIGYYFIKIKVVGGGKTGAVRLHPLSIANFRVKGLNSGILMQRRFIVLSSDH